MQIDTSSYYPEVPSSGGNGDPSLNSRETGLFGNPGGGSGENKDKPRGQTDTGAVIPENDRCKPDFNPGKGENRFLTVVSNFLSWAFVPMLIPVYGVLLAFNLSLLELVTPGLKLVFTLIVVAIDAVLPMLLFFLLKKTGVVATFGLNERKDRPVPYIIMIVAYGLTAWFFAAKGAPLWLSMFFAGGALAALVNLAVNFFWKISAHAAGIAGLVAMLVRIEKEGWSDPSLTVWLIATIAVAGLLGSARVWLGRHTVWQVLAGYAVGFCSVFFLSTIR